MINEHDTRPPNKNDLTTMETAAILRVSGETVRKEIREGTLPARIDPTTIARRARARYLIDRGDLLAWLGKRVIDSTTLDMRGAELPTPPPLTDPDAAKQTPTKEDDDAPARPADQAPTRRQGRPRPQKGDAPDRGGDQGRRAGGRRPRTIELPARDAGGGAPQGNNRGGRHLGPGRHHGGAGAGSQRGEVASARGRSVERDQALDDAIRRCEELRETLLTRRNGIVRASKTLTPQQTERVAEINGARQAYLDLIDDLNNMRRGYPFGGAL